MTSLLFIAAVMLLGVAVHSQSVGDVAISAPDIYPPDGTFTGEVEVKFVANQPDATIYWTKNGDVPTNASRQYEGPFTLFEPGTYLIQAMAVPKTGNLESSVIRNRTYTILKSEVPIPSVTPAKGKYRGQVVAQLLAPADIASNPNAKIQYVVDVDDPGNTWQTYTAPIVLDTPGEHIIKSRIVIGGGEGTNMKMSPTARYRFEVTAPLVYDVTTECVKCEKTPTVGQVFTIWLQNPEVNAVMKLTTSSRGCELDRHILDDTIATKIQRRQLAYRFVTYTEPQPKVYVCLQEPSHPNKTFVMVPRRLKSSAQGVGDNYFAIEPAFGAIKKQHTEKPYDGPTHQPFAERSNFSVAFVLLFAFLIIVLFATCTTMGRLFKGRQHPRVPRATVVQDDDA
jgi:hypothetical protein